jgi:Ser/Thr protein kinase RdoA (MazF antagonist)
VPPADLAAATAVLCHWARLGPGPPASLAGGLINLTLQVAGEGGEGYVLQRLHPIFRSELHEDIAAVTAHLAARDVPTPRLVPTDAGALCVEAGGVWRLTTRVPGITYARVPTPAIAAEAGALLGRFHHALRDLDHAFRFRRQAHGLALHGEALRRALASHPDHRLHGEVAELAAELLARAAEVPPVDRLPPRITHGDPKITNVLFHPADRAHALVDLDTLGRLALPLELGDALRSWCNPEGEDGGQPALDLQLLAAALTGYGSTAGMDLTLQERSSVVDGLAYLTLELATRFAADALQERYFGWSPDRFPAAGEHHLHRARVQAALARSVADRRAAAEATVRTALG